MKNIVVSPNFHTKKLGEITIFFALLVTLSNTDRMNIENHIIHNNSEEKFLGLEIGSELLFEGHVSTF